MRKLVIALWIVSACSSEGGEAGDPPDTSTPLGDASTLQDADIDARVSDATLPPMDSAIADVSAPDAALPEDAALADATLADATLADTGVGTLIQTREGGGFGSLQVVGNAAGEVVAIWQQNDVSQVDRIWSTYYSSAAGWSTPVEIEAHATGAFIIDLAIDDAGNAFALWHEVEDPYDRSWANRYQVGSGWGAPTRLENLGVNARASRISMFPDNTALVLGEAGANGNRYAWSNRFTGTVWQTASAFDSTNPVFTPDLSADQAGNAMAVWCSWDGSAPPFKLIAHRFDAQTGWEAAVTVPIASGSCVIPHVSTVAEDHFLALHHVWDGNYPTLWGAPYRAGAWRTGTQVEDADKRSSGIALPDVATDALGNSTVVWAASTGIWGKTYAGDGSWGAPSLLSTGTGSGYNIAELTANGAGDVVLVWYRGSDAKSMLFARRAAGGAWLDTSLPVLQTSGVFKAVVDASGTLTSLWTALEGTTSKLWTTRTQLPR